MRAKLFSPLFLILAIFWTGSAVLAQITANPGDIRISGTVRDINTHQEIGNVNITIEGTPVGTISNFTGRFTLVIPAEFMDSTVVLQHISYEPVRASVDSLRKQRYVYLQPRIIELQGVAVEEVGAERSDIAKDIPQPISYVEAKEFEIRGYVDAGDLLKNDHSIQVEEELSGKKTVAIRGGNPDEVVVLFNGIKMNSNYDNVFDLSLIDLEDIARFEIIKGSNTTLYGPEAFSGVINIVPKIQQDYTLRFQQRLGTYRSGNWGIHLFRKFNALRGGYSFKQGGANRKFISTAETAPGGLENRSEHHTANLSYSFADHPDGRPANVLGAMFIATKLGYDNLRDNEFLDNKNLLGSLRYTREVGSFNNFDMSFSYRSLDETQILLINGNFERAIDDRSFHFNAEKRFILGQLEWLGSYQLQVAELDFIDRNESTQLQEVGLESADLRRRHHGFVSIVKLQNAVDAEFLKSFEMDISLRHDRVSDEQNNPVLRGGGSDTGLFGNSDWNETVFKFSAGMEGYRNFMSFHTYLNFGTNVKFPTLFQQISSPLTLTAQRFTPSLEPEKNRSIEIGFDLTREFRGQPVIYGWNIAGNFFQNQFENKFRLSSTPGVPVTFYDNVPDAHISGIEASTSLYLYRKKVTFGYAISKYNISEKAAFPFKSDFKHRLNLFIDHRGYSFQMHLFHEGEQAGWLRLIGSDNNNNPASAGFGEITLPSYTNMDLHLSKSFEIAQLKLFLNVSGRNILNAEDVVLEGLAIRDRRLYLTMGAQY